MGNIWSAAPVFRRDRSRVEGFVRTAKVVTRQNQVVVTRRISEHVSLSLPDIGACSAKFESGLAGVSLEPDQALTLAPGKYGAVSVKSRARLSLSAGSYQFQALTLEPQALVQLPPGGGSVLFIQSAFTHRGSFIDAGGAIAPIVIAYFGSQSAAIEGAFRGAIVAPNARVDLFRRAEGYRGVFFARDLELHANMTVRQDPTALIP